MNALLLHAIAANLIMAVMLGGYTVALRRSSWLAGRRAWLLGMAVLALLLPMLPLPADMARPIRVTLPLITVQAGDRFETSSSVVQTMLTWHAAIAALLLLRLSYRTRSAMRAVRKGGPHAISFFGGVHVPAEADGESRAAMLAHEGAHARLGHSFDVLFLEGLAAVYWSNPLWRLALRELRRVHEHQADEYAARTVPCYPEILLAQALGTRSSSILNRFHSTNLKIRLLMLTRKLPQRRARFLIAAPLLLLCLLANSAFRLPMPWTPQEAVVFTGPDQEAEFPGGQPALMRYLAEQIRYPETAQEEGVEGVVHIAFTIQADGKVTGATVKRGVRDDLDRESVRVVSGMPDWKPARVKGKAVASEMMLPIAFRLASK